MNITSTQPPPSISPTEEGNATWLLKRRHEEMGTMFRAVWDNYIKFYTVFLTFSVAGMGWLLSRGNAGPLPKAVDHVVAVVFIAQSILTAITSGSIAVYSRRVGREYIEVEKAILGSVNIPPTLLGTETVPVRLAMWAGWANTAAMLGMTFAWAYVGFRASGF